VQFVYDAFPALFTKAFTKKQPFIVGICIASDMLVFAILEIKTQSFRVFVVPVLSTKRHVFSLLNKHFVNEE